MNHICPHCNSTLNTQGFQRGQLITCALCLKPFQLPIEEVIQQPVNPQSNVPPPLPSPPPLPPAQITSPANTKAMVQDSATSQVPFITTERPGLSKRTSSRRGLSNKTSAPSNIDLILAVASLIALFIGIFTPIMSFGPGSLSLFDSLQNSQGLSRGLICLLLVGLGIGSCITYFPTKQSMYLLIAAIASTIATLIFLFFYIDLANNVSDITGNNEIAQAITIMMKPSLDLGFILLVLASGMLYFAFYKTS